MFIAWKKRKRNALASLVTVLVMITGLLLLGVRPVYADTEHIIDASDLFTDAEESMLEEECKSYTEQTGMDIRILTAGNDLVGGDSEDDTIKYVERYDNANFPDRGAISLIINMDIRYYYIDVMGNKPLNVYNDSRQWSIQEAVVGELKEGDLAGAADAFIDSALDIALTAAQTDDTGSYQNYEDPGFAYEEEAKHGFWGFFTPQGLGISALLALVVSMIVIFAMRSKHHEKQMALSADHYVRPNSMNLYVTKDRFVSQYVTRTAKPQDTNKGGGGGGTSIHMSGGHPHSGGGGHF